METGEAVASISLDCPDEEAAIQRFKAIAAFMPGELWRGKVRLRVFAPELVAVVH
ncbi:hypothetical protein [Pelagerythrobacter rhizovicinus]|uniref:hypothetical protein n=1 Tax=Pelagerythrobacter rhizovicinus TaxID=2268576 RepID=UPI0013EC7CEE|nr:hypothetical protein [Pelagerythrobacter rhizovicinus]